MPVRLVERAVGRTEPAIHGRYGVSHLHDFYGFGGQGYLSSQGEFLQLRVNSRLRTYALHALA